MYLEFKMSYSKELAENILERKHSRVEVPLARKKASSVGQRCEAGRVGADSGGHVASDGGRRLVLISA